MGKLKKRVQHWARWVEKSSVQSTFGICAEVRDANGYADVERHQGPIQNGDNDRQEDEESQTNLSVSASIHEENVPIEEAEPRNIPTNHDY